jgi:hypothetical protein
VHKGAQTNGIRARRKRLQNKSLSPRKMQNETQPFMFHYPSVLAAWCLLLASGPKRIGKQLKHSETEAAQASLLKHSETLR